VPSRLTGSEGLRGQAGVATTDTKEKAKVYAHGESWNAETNGSIAAGDRVVVTALRGMTVKVNKERGEV
jgi:membrane-bound serine protease (ClpP class)